MTKITKIRGAPAEKIASDLRTKLDSQGYKADVTSKGNSVNISQVRRKESDNVMRTQSTKSGMRRTNMLAWDDWVTVNNDINDVMDDNHATGNSSSLHGKFKIREGNRRYGEQDWEGLKYENVGSQVSPVSRYDYVTRAHAAKKRIKDIT